MFDFVRQNDGSPFENLKDAAVDLEEMRRSLGIPNGQFALRETGQQGSMMGENTEVSERAGSHERFDPIVEHALFMG